MLLMFPMVQKEKKRTKDFNSLYVKPSMIRDVGALPYFAFY